MMRDPGGALANVAGARRRKGQTPFKRFAASKSPIRREGGWVGMIVLLLALAIVAWLSKDALKQYAFMAPAATSVKTGAASPGERTRAPGAVDASGATVESAAPTPTAPVERARGVESTLKRQEGQRGGGY
jgi:hypothetical protein